MDETLELLTTLLGGGRARQLLGGEPVVPLPVLATMSAVELEQLTGIDRASAERLQAAFALGRLINAWPVAVKPRFEGSLDVVRLLQAEVDRLQREHLILLALDSRYRLIERRLVTIGTTNELLVHPRDLFYFAVRQMASAVIVVHNHPGGDPKPSEEDVCLTTRLYQVGELLGIPLLDHIIMTADGGYFSFAEVYGSCELSETGDTGSIDIV